jgi:hypothetical protein
LADEDVSAAEEFQHGFAVPAIDEERAWNVPMSNLNAA